MTLRARHWLAGAAVATASLALTAALVGDQLSRPVRHAVGAAPADLGASALQLRTEQGLAVAGWLAPGRPGQGMVLLLHGVRGDRRSMLARAGFLHQRGYGVLLIDLPGHGESAGERITFGQREGEGVRAALAYLAEHFPAEKRAVIGVSLGAAAMVLARPTPAPAAVVLESMYPTIDDAVADRLGMRFGQLGRVMAPLLLWQLPWRLDVTRAQLRPIDALGQLHVPLLIAAGARDRHTRLEETRQLYAAANGPKSLWIIDGAGHVDLYAYDRVRYEQTVGAFLAATMAPR